MTLFFFGKEFIVINEEIAIYLSFLIVLTILINNLGQVLVNQFNEQKNKISSSYSLGSQEEEKVLSKITTNSIKTCQFVISEISFENARIKKFLILTEVAVSLVVRELTRKLGFNN